MLMQVGVRTYGISQILAYPFLSPLPVHVAGWRGPM